MQRVRIWWSVSTLIVLTILFGYGFNANAQGTGTIKGKVTGDGNVALANVTVKAYYQENITGIIVWTYGGLATTDNTGAYTIANLNAGTYHVSFNEYPPLAGYFMEFYDNAGTQESATEIALAEGATVNNINAQLSSGAHIKGKVTDLQGNALADIRVIVGSSGGVAGGGMQITGANGLYDIGNLLGGSYTIVFEDMRETPLYRGEYFNNAREAANATTLTLAAEQTLTGINAQLDHLGFITGKVTDAQNKSLPGIQLVAQRQLTGPNGSSWTDERFSASDATGNYKLGGLQEGVYRVRFNDTNQLKYSSEYYNNVYTATTATPLTITLNTTTTNINAQLALRGGITGRVTNVAGAPLANINVTAEAYFEREPGNVTWQQARATQTDANGVYRLCCLDTLAHRVNFFDPTATYLPEYYDNVLYGSPYDVPEDFIPINVTAEVTTTNINAQLSQPSKLISIVTDQQNQPLPEIRVTIYRYNAANNGQWENSSIYPSMVNNSYATPIRPGRYRVQFEDSRSIPRYIGEFYDNAADLATATDITITEESTVTITAVLADKARIDGHVTDQGGNKLPNIEVSAWQPSTFPGMPWNQVANTTTDQNGRYSLAGLGAGTYRVGFAIRYPPEFFAGEFYNNVTDIDAATDITVLDNTATANIDAQLGHLSRLQGQVTDKNGTPLSTIAVTFYRYSDQGNKLFNWTYYSSAYSDFAGVYSSPTLAPGLYRVGFHDSSNIYHPAFYTNAGYLENATTITLTTDLTITGINAQLPANPFTWPPLAQDDQIIVAEGGIISSVNNGMGSVLANDRADSGGLLQAHVVTMPTHGTLTFNPDGTFTYMHNGDEATSDFFTYGMNDGTQPANIAKVHITIQPINDPPIARNDSVSVGRGQRIITLDSGAKSLLANDSDPDSAVLTATLKGGPTHGAVTINANGAFTYTHDGSAGDSDSFTYQATDALNASTVATVTVTINPFTFSKTVSIANIKPLCTPVDEMRVPVGTTIVYCYTIRNIGDVPLTTHTLVDSHLGTLLTNHSQPVAAGATFSVTFTQTLTVSTTNIATWTATSLTGQSVTAAPPSATAKKAAAITIASATDDSDGDGIPDNLEKAGDIDGDNLPNFLDTDADGDGQLDKEEVGSNPSQPLDSNQNGVPDYLENQGGTLEQQKLFLPVINR